MAPSATKENEKSWPVHVFRRTDQGWHRMRVTSSRRPGRSVTVKATPRRNYIALLRLQVRIRLVQPSTDTENSNEIVHTTVIRRRHCLLISSSQKLRSLLLRFRDVQACLEFVDRLQLLNPSPQLTPEIQDPRQRQQPPNHATNINAIQNNNNHIQHSANNPPAIARQHGTVAESRQVLSYVGSLLLDEDFANMVDHLEATITASEDGARMLEALVFGGTSLADGPDNHHSTTAADENDNNDPGEH